MTSIRRNLISIPVLAVLLLTSCLSTDFLPRLEGVNRIIGTVRFQMDDPRGLVIQAWYPASGVGNGIIDPLMTKEEALIFTGGFLPLSKEDFESSLPSNSYINAPILTTDEPFPIIIFEHGFEGYEKQNMTQMEELASQGYVVFAINHPGESFVTLYPDGTVSSKDDDRYPSLMADTRKGRKSNAEVTRAFMETMRNAPGDPEKIEAMRVYSSIPRISSLNLPIKERVRDVLNFMEHLNYMSENGFFAGSIDTDRVGMYGHSMGGATTTTVAGLGEWPVNLRAAVNLDGPQLLFPGDPLTVPQVPFMMAYSTATYVDGITVDLVGGNDWLVNECESETGRIVFNGSTHVNFTDLTYVKFLEGKSTGKIDGTEFGLALERLLVAWFDRTVKGQNPDFKSLIDSYDHWDVTYRPAR